MMTDASHVRDFIGGTEGGGGVVRGEDKAGPIAEGL